MTLIGSIFSVFAQSIGLWASVIAISGGVTGFVALAFGRPTNEVLTEAQMGAIAATPSGFFLFLAGLFLFE